VGDVIATHDSHHPHHLFITHDSHHPPTHTKFTAPTPLHHAHTYVAGRRPHTTAPHRGTHHYHHPTRDTHRPRARHRIPNALRLIPPHLLQEIVVPSPPPLHPSLSSPLVLNTSPPIIQQAREESYPPPQERTLVLHTPSRRKPPPPAERNVIHSHTRS